MCLPIEQSTMNWSLGILFVDVMLQLCISCKNYIVVIQKAFWNVMQIKMFHKNVFIKVKQ